MMTPGKLRDTTGRGAMILTALSTLVAFADGLGRMRAASDDRLWIEGWRTFGYVVFAGLFALLAARPRRSPGLGARPASGARVRTQARHGDLWCCDR